LVHHLGWDEQWDTWFPVASYRIAPFRTFTRPWIPALGPGDRLEVRHEQKWFRAVVQHRTETVLVTVMEPSGIPKTLDLSQDRDNMNPLGVHTLGPYRTAMHICQAYPRPKTQEIKCPLYLGASRNPRMFDLVSTLVDEDNNR